MIAKYSLADALDLVPGDAYIGGIGTAINNANLRGVKSDCWPNEPMAKIGMPL